MIILVYSNFDLMEVKYKIYKSLTFVKLPQFLIIKSYVFSALEIILEIWVAKERVQSNVTSKSFVKVVI